MKQIKIKLKGRGILTNEVKILLVIINKINDIIELLNKYPDEIFGYYNKK